MLNFGQIETEARFWDISIRERVELQARAAGGICRNADSEDAERKEGEFRACVGDVLISAGLAKKAARYMECSRFAVCLECDGDGRHRFFSPLYCDLRFCPRCGRRMFARLYAKYVPVLSYLRSHHCRGYGLREITLTSKNEGTLTSEQIKRFNLEVKNTLKRLMHHVSGWGAIWCDEVGFDNFNLHAHILFYGPYIDQKRLAEVWHEISGHQVVWIRPAHAKGPLALRHLLKYVGKPPASKPEIIGQLEVAFHGRRRVHALGVFYNFAGADPDNEESEWTSCPICGAGLHHLPGTYKIEDLALSGLKFIGERRPRRKEWVN